MTPPHGLPEVEIDRLRELSSVGAASAARALSQVLSRRILIRAPVVRPAAEPVRGESSTAVFFEAEGDVSGVVALVLPEASRLKILALLLRSDVAPAEVAESALRELGNIVASHTVSAIADALDSRILLSVPALMITADTTLISRVAERGARVRIESELYDREGEVYARLLLVPDLPKAEW